MLFVALMLVSYMGMAQHPVQSKNSDSVAVEQLYRNYAFRRSSLPEYQPKQWRRTYDAIMADTTRRCVLKSLRDTYPV